MVMLMLFIFSDLSRKKSLPVREGFVILIQIIPWCQSLMTVTVIIETILTSFEFIYNSKEYNIIQISKYTSEKFYKKMKK